VILADILQWFLLILGAMLTLNAHWLLAFALFPGVVARARERYVRQPMVVTLVGLAIAVPAGLLSIIVTKSLDVAPVKFAVVGLLLVLASLALIGSTGLVERIGSGLSAPTDEQRPWRRVLRGGIVLALSFLMPFLGWFALLPWTIVSGLGAWALAGRAPKRVSKVSVPDVQS
jgi:hypothetical protein